MNVTSEQVSMLVTCSSSSSMVFFEEPFLLNDRGEEAMRIGGLEIGGCRLVFFGHVHGSMVLCSQ